MKRRDFLQGAFCSVGSMAIGGCSSLWTDGTSSRFKLAMAGYTLNKFDADAALKFCRNVGVHDLCVKARHLPFDATVAQIAEFRRKCADCDVLPYGVGPIYMYGTDDLRRYFDYASALGVGLIVGVPGRKTGPNWIDCHSDRKVCEKVSDMAKEYDIRYAIHNHGRNPKTGNPNLYPAVPETYTFIRDLDPRVGLCVDWAYTYADGLDCREIAHAYRDRIFDGHIRCLADRTNGSSGINPAGRAFDYDEIFAALREIGYDGCLGLELANAFPLNPQWISESYSYFRGLM